MTKELLEVTDQMKRLTQSTVDDSTAVKVITNVSAVYLPCSFVGVSSVTLTASGLSLPNVDPIRNELLCL
jgi:predicted nucleotidyltransferase